MGRKILAITAGLIVGLLIIFILRVVTIAYFPFPDSLTWKNPSDMNTYFNGLPDSAFVLIIASHGLGALFGALITALISKKQRFTNGIITGAIVFTFILVVNFTYDFPKVYLMIDTLATAVAAFAGASFGQGRKV